MQELNQQLKELLGNIRQAIKQLDLERDEAKLAELETVMLAPDFWDDAAQAASISQQAAALKQHAGDWRALESEASEAQQLGELGDNKLQDELEQTYKALADRYNRREFELKLAGPHDKASAIMAIHAGAGGTDAQDWAQMLLRMYLRYGERAGFQTAVLDQSAGEEAGIKSVTFEVNGPWAYGKLKSEKGVHRLVRLSPFNSDNLRQTSFALVEIWPQVEKTELAIDPKDLKIEVFRAGGHGGQSVNTTDSAVRITHLPTGLAVAMQNERSQLQNKAKAMTILEARLVALMEEEHKAQLSELKGVSLKAEWGSQIRSYVLHPYNKVKDNRSGFETADTKGVLDGDLDQLIEAYLKSQIKAAP